MEEKKKANSKIKIISKCKKIIQLMHDRPNYLCKWEIIYYYAAFYLKKRE